MERIKKIKYIFDIKEHFDTNLGHKEKIVDCLKLTGYQIDSGDTCYLYYKGNRYTFFDDGDIWFDKSAEEYLPDLFDKIDILYRKKKIENILKNK